MKVLKKAERAITKHIKRELPGFTITNIDHQGYGVYTVKVKSISRVGVIKASTDYARNPLDGIVLDVESMSDIEKKF